MSSSRRRKSRLPTKTKTHALNIYLNVRGGANDNCRFCEVSFKIQFSNLRKLSHSSSENTFKSSKRKDCFGAVLSEICCQVRLPLTRDSATYSDRVYNPCGRKIRNWNQLYQFVKKAASTKTSTPVKSSK